MKPYTYLLHHKPTNMFYYGVRFAKNCHPDEFWLTYFTSSKKQVPLLRTLFGDDSFQFEIRQVFDSVEKARNWESKVLRRMKVLKKSDTWLNKTDNKAILYDVSPRLGKTHKEETKLKISKTKQGYVPWNKNTVGLQKGMKGDKNPNYGKIPWNGGKVGCYSEKTKFQMGSSNRGKTWKFDKNLNKRVWI